MTGMWTRCCAVALLLCCSTIYAAPAKRPNIIFILADDLGAGDLSLNGSVIRTPNLDRMAREGAYLDSFYASANVCSPSRAGLLTGRYPIRSGMAHKVIEPESTHGLPAEEITLAEMLQAQGYRTALVGKWHLGHTKEFWPTRHGFEYFFGLPYSNDMSGVALYRNKKKIEEPPIQSTLTRRYTEETIQLIQEKQDNPFFIYLSHTFPHIPLHASKQFKGKSRAGLYGDAVEELDWSVGEVMKALEENGLEQDTLVFFSSDNGAWFEGSNGTYRDMKGLTWEGAYRVPLIAWWPGQITAGSRSSAMAMNIDILPTIADIVNENWQSASMLDGKNIWPLLNGANESPHERLYLFNNEDIAAVRTQDWKYVARTYYKTRYVALERIRGAMGFDYELLFNMNDSQLERYSQAENQPMVLKMMQAHLEQGRGIFDPLRTLPEPEVFP